MFMELSCRRKRSTEIKSRTGEIILHLTEEKAGRMMDPKIRVKYNRLIK